MKTKSLLIRKKIISSREAMVLVSNTLTLIFHHLKLRVPALLCILATTLSTLPIRSTLFPMIIQDLNNKSKKIRLKMEPARWF